jgi:hypothetical protein
MNKNEGFMFASHFRLEIPALLHCDPVFLFLQRLQTGQFVLRCMKGASAKIVQVVREISKNQM